MNKKQKFCFDASFRIEVSVSLVTRPLFIDLLKNRQGNDFPHIHFK